MFYVVIITQLTGKIYYNLLSISKIQPSEENCYHSWTVRKQVNKIPSLLTFCCYPIQQKGFQIKWLIFTEEEENKSPGMTQLGGIDCKDLTSTSQMYSFWDFLLFFLRQRCLLQVISFVVGKGSCQERPVPRVTLTHSHLLLFCCKFTWLQVKRSSMRLWKYNLLEEKILMPASSHLLPQQNIYWYTGGLLSFLHGACQDIQLDKCQPRKSNVLVKKRENLFSIASTFLPP